MDRPCFLGEGISDRGGVPPRKLQSVSCPGKARTSYLVDPRRRCPKMLQSRERSSGVMWEEIVLVTFALRNQIHVVISM
jgi:hypothetical protein